MKNLIKWFFLLNHLYKYNSLKDIKVKQNKHHLLLRIHRRDKIVLSSTNKMMYPFKTNNKIFYNNSHQSNRYLLNKNLHKNQIDNRNKLSNFEGSLIKGRLY